MRPHNNYVYILSNESNKVIYTGVTNDLVRRIHEHKTGKFKGFTYKYQVKKLLYFEKFDSIVTAIAREKQIKGYTREKKNRLIDTMNPEWKELIV